MANLRISGKLPLWKLLLIMVSKDGAITSAASFRIRGDKPSRPVALVTSKDFKMHIKSGSLILGISNYTFSGIRDFTWSFSLPGSYSGSWHASFMSCCKCSLILAKNAFSNY